MKKKKRNGTEEDGFTFVETLGVLAVAAVLAGGVGISTMKIIEKARVSQTRDCIMQYKNALQTYYLDEGKYPTTQQGLEALWEKPVLSPMPENWDGPYIDRAVQRDPWGNSYIYLKKGDGRFPEDCPENLPFVILSYGADGVKGGEGNNQDICSWK